MINIIAIITTSHGRLLYITLTFAWSYLENHEKVPPSAGGFQDQAQNGSPRTQPEMCEVSAHFR